MKQLFKFSLFAVLIILIVSCMKIGTVPTFDPALTNSNWQRFVEHDPNAWKRAASRWFLFGEANFTEIGNRLSASRIAMSTTMVQVGDFSTIDSNGGYQLQIFGSDQNTVYVYGPNLGNQAVSISERGGTLYIRQTQRVPYHSINNVIVRVGVKNLDRLIQRGTGNIEGVYVRGHDLSIISTGPGCIYLMGECLKLRSVRQSGYNVINVFGVESSYVRLVQSGAGRMNIMGKVGVKSIHHYGTGDINIIGANTDALDIYAEGAGKVSLCGIVNLCSVVAKCDAHVYVQGVRSREKLLARLSDRAIVGLAGSANIVDVVAIDKSIFEGRSLCARVAYVRACNHSHVNLSADKRAFVSAKDVTKVYVYSDGDVLDPLTYGYANVLMLPGLRACQGRVYSFKSAPREERVYVGAG